MKRTALYEHHKAAGGRLIDFGGWEMPVQYTGVMDEHNACRTAAGLFDVSHMGEFHIEGPDAEAFLDHLVTNQVSKLVDGQAMYTAMCHEHGGIVDDLVIYRRSKDRFLAVVNASNTDKDFNNFQKIAKKFPNLKLTNESANYSQIAIQGRKAQEILEPFADLELSEIGYYKFKEGKILATIPCIFSRTGYTGEDGFELYVPWSEGPRVWDTLLEAGRPLGLKPVGLGARDTLRLEMKFPLYGNELTDETNPLEAGLGWVTKLTKPDFVGKKALEPIKAQGVKRKLVGIKLEGKGIPRHGYSLHTADGSRQIGVLTSGTQSPSLQIPIGIGYVETALAEVGTKLTVDIRGNKLPATIVPTPFYKRPY